MPVNYAGWGGHAKEVGCNPLTYRTVEKYLLPSPVISYAQSSILKRMLGNFLKRLTKVSFRRKRKKERILDISINTIFGEQEGQNVRKTIRSRMHLQQGPIDG